MVGVCMLRREQLSPAHSYMKKRNGISQANRKSVKITTMKKNSRVRLEFRMLGGNEISLCIAIAISKYQ